MPVCPPASEPLREDWDVLWPFLPADWEGLAGRTAALRKPRKDKLPRTLLLHLGCCHSLRETTVRACGASLAGLSAVALMERLKKCRYRLQALCVALLRKRG